MKKQAAMIAICAALLVCVAAAGCTSSTSSSPTPSATANSSPQAATASATVTPTPTATPTATVTPTPTATPSPSASSSGGTAGLTVLFFYEPGCPYCAALESTSSFQQLQSKVPVQWIVSAGDPRTDQYGVNTDPTLILLKNGAEVGRWVNPTDATGILAQINAG